MGQKWAFLASPQGPLMLPLTSWITSEALLTQPAFCSVSLLLHRVITKLSAMRHRKPKIHSSRLHPFKNCQSLCAKVLQLSPTLCDPVDCSLPAPLSMGFPRQDYWSGLPCPPPGDLADPGMGPTSPALAGGLFATSAAWEARAFAG